MFITTVKEEERFTTQRKTHNYMRTEPILKVLLHFINTIIVRKSKMGLILYLLGPIHKITILTTTANQRLSKKNNNNTVPLQENKNKMIPKSRLTYKSRQFTQKLQSILLVF